MSIIGSHFFTFFALTILSILPAQAEFTLLNSPSLITNHMPAFIPVDQAFPFSFIQQGNRVYLDWQIMPGYYLYQNKINVIPSNGAKINILNTRHGQPYEDKFFGKVQIYKQPLTVTVPIISATRNSTFKVIYQDCAEVGFCYSPKTVTILLSTASTDAADTPKIFIHLQPLPTISCPLRCRTKQSQQIIQRYQTNQLISAALLTTGGNPCCFLA
nr:protein-disulfide reductase DsbD domain-containing protein [Candidatus Enterovibrio luxaltus]